MHVSMQELTSNIRVHLHVLGSALPELNTVPITCLEPTVICNRPRH